MRARHRYLYYTTGIPGWSRFGYSPGWGGLPPGAQYLMTGTWPPYPVPAGTPVPPAYPVSAGMPAIPAQQEISTLKSQTAMLEQQLEAIKKRINELKR